MKRWLIWLLLLCLPLSGCVTILSGTAEQPESSGCTALAWKARAEFDANGGVSGGGRKYCDYWQRPMEDWCVDFLYYCADQASLVGNDKPFGTHTANTAAAWRRLQDGGAKMFTLTQATPQAGDIVWWYVTDGGCASTLEAVDDTCHVGIVVDFADGTMTTVEGNCGTGQYGTSYVAKHSYSGDSLYGQSWQGAAVFGFARLVAAGVTDSLTEMVKAFEGFSLYPVWDYSQWSVGYGTRCPDSKLAQYQRYGIPSEDATALLRQHLDSAVSAVNRYISSNDLPYTEQQRDSLASLTYNIGAGWLTEGSYPGFKQALQTGTEAQIMQAFAEICHAGGEALSALVERRLCEAHLFLTGQYITDYRLSGYDYTITGQAVTIYKTEGR